jgi:tryptophan synthase alpha chain
VAESMSKNVAAIRKSIPLPVAVGFGISTPAQAADVARDADGVVVGSAIVKLFEEFAGDELKHRLRTFVAELKAGVRNR